MNRFSVFMLVLSSATFLSSGGALTAVAADYDIAGTVAMPGSVAGLTSITDNITATVANQAAGLEISFSAPTNGDGVAQIGNLDIDQTATLGIYDAFGATQDIGGNDLLINSIDIAAPASLTVILNGDKQDGTGNNSGDFDVRPSLSGDITGGGDLIIQGVSNVNAFTSFIVSGDVALGDLTVQSGDSGVTGSGSDAPVAFGTDSTNSFTANNINVIGGAATGFGWSAQVATLGILGNATLTGDVLVNAGASNGMGADGGDAFINFFGDVTSTGILALISSDNSFIGGGNASASLSGDANFTAITMDDQSGGSAQVSLDVWSGTAQTISGTIDGFDAAEGDLVISGGSIATFNDTIGAINGLDTVQISGASSRAIFLNNVNATTLDNNAAVQIAAGSSVSANTLSGTGVYILNASDTNNTLEASDFGTLVDNDTGTTLNISDISINLATAIQAGTVSNILTGINVSADGDITDNSVLYNFALANNGANTDLTVTQEDLNTAFGNDNLVHTGNVILNSAISTGRLKEIQDNLSTTTSLSAAQDIVQASVGDTSGSTVENASITVSQSARMIANRMSALRTAGRLAGNNQTGSSFQEIAGVTAGSYIQQTSGQGPYADLANYVNAYGSAAGVDSRVKLWAQAYAQTAEQGEYSTQAGYDLNTYGAVIGLDIEDDIIEDAAVGLAFLFSETEIDDHSINDIETDINSYQLSLYSDYRLGEQGYVSGQVGYTHSTNTTTRYNVGNVNNLNANADYNSHNIFAQLEAGKTYALSPSIDYTSRVSGRYTYHHTDEYTETNAGNAGLTVEADDLSTLEIGTGLDLAYNWTSGGRAILKPMLSVGVRYDLLGETYSATNRFVGGGSAFQVTGVEPEPITLDTSFSLAYSPKENLELIMAYERETKKEFSAHTGSVKIAYRW